MRVAPRNRTSGLAASDASKTNGRSARVILIAVGFSVFVAADDLTVVSTMLRPIVNDLGLVLPDGLDDAAWIVNAYLIAFIAVMPFAGRLSDVIGRRRTFLAAWLVFLVGTVWIPLANSLGTLLAGRILTAIGGGSMVPVALAVVGEVYPPNKRARALGTLGAIETLGWVWGPLYGAMLVRFLAWEWQFWLNVPLAVAGAASVWWALKDHDRPDQRIRIDWFGAVLMTTALVSLNVALLGSAEVQSIEGLKQLTGDDGADLRLFYFVAFASGFAFAWHQRRLRISGRETLIDTNLFRGRNVKLALVVNFLVGATLIIAMVDVPLLVNAVELNLEQSAIIAGWVLSALTSAMALASYVGGRYTERTWYGPPIVVGLIASTAAFTSMGLTWSSGTSYLVLATQLAVLGIGIGLTIAPTTSAVVGQTAAESRGAAAGVVMVVRMIGLSVGLSALTAWGLARFNARRGAIELPPITDPDFTDAVALATGELTARAIADTFSMSAAALGVGLVLALILIRRPMGSLSGLTGRDDFDTSDHDPIRPDAASSSTRSILNQEAAIVMPTDHSHDDAQRGNDHEFFTPTDDDQPSPAVGSQLGTEPGDERNDTEDPPDYEYGHGSEPPAEESGRVNPDEKPRSIEGLTAEVEDPWVHRKLTTITGVFALLIVGMIGLLVVALLHLSATRNDLEQSRADLATTREDMNRVEAGVAIYASQISGFVETINDFAPSIEGGLNQAIAGLEAFSSSTIEFTVNIDENVSISENFTIDRDLEVPVNESLPIVTEFDTTIIVDGPFGIDIPFDITVPVDVNVPIDLIANIPINESLPIEVDVPVQLDIPISIEVKETELQQLSQSLIDGLRAFQAGFGDLTTG